jgi:hypothetical protein
MGYYSLEFKRESEPWTRAKNLFNRHFACKHFEGVEIQRIVALYNPKYQFDSLIDSCLWGFCL